MRNHKEKPNNWLRQLVNHLMWWKRPKNPPFDVQTARNMVQMVAMTVATEYSCADAYQLLDQFAEVVASGENVAALMPLVYRHLEMCQDCREEFEALLRVVLASRDSSG